MKYTINYGQQQQPIFVLLHGTGGDELSLLEVGEQLNPYATQIGIKGNVSENGHQRYFKRLEEGVYDEEDLAIRANELHEFIGALIKANQFEKKEIVLIGYSNGANISIRLLLEYSKVYKKAVLFHPMYPLEVLEEKSLKDTQIFATFGSQDPIVPIAESERVIHLFEGYGAEMTKEWSATHQLTYKEVMQAKKWLQNVSSIQ